MEGPLERVDRQRLAAEVEGGEGVEEVVGEPFRAPLGEARAQRAARAGERLVGAGPGAGQGVEPAGLDEHVVLDEREHLGVAAGERPVARHRRAVRADPHHRGPLGAGALEGLQARREVGLRAGDHVDCDDLLRVHRAAG